ncbi:amidohydrolase/deacetylase family metallohydrolase [Candidatus Bathyarchaeota archaeon]|nr:amidohydrolase/deacetylase family metallohydrolase [Candidatus Bathyarchaeota archaeon]
MYDLIIKGGFLIDPYQKIQGYYDVAFERGGISKVEESIDDKDGRKILDAAGKMVVPGLIDLHTHVYWGVSHFGIDADSRCLDRGVTTVVDAGSAGALTFRGFRRFIVEKSRTRIFSFLHIATIGLTTDLPVGELRDLKNLDYEKAVEVGKENRDLIYGIKIRLGEREVGDYAPQALRLAKEAAKELRVPLMVHPGVHKSFTISDILSVLEHGDIMTHCFAIQHPWPFHQSTILNEKGEVIPEAWDARRRGILFDVGHGVGSFSFSTAEKALRQGFIPDTISTDLHAYNVDYLVFDLPTTLSKFLALGLSLEEVIELSTSTPSSALGLNGKIGTLKPGAEGDAVILEVDEGNFIFRDPLNEERRGTKKLNPVAVVKGGEVASADPRIFRKPINR